MKKPADDAPFFGHGGEDEIGVAFGKIVKVALGAVAEPFAENPARTDGDLGLGDMVAGAERVIFRVEEDKNAVLLVRLHAEKIDERGEYGDRARLRR